MKAFVVSVVSIVGAGLGLVSCAAATGDDGASAAAGSSAAGSSAGGSSSGATGGTTSTGGAASTGGARNTGGTTGTGGATSTGGAENSGGTTSTGGMTSTGGAPPVDPCIQNGTCPPGTWIDVTPPSLGITDFGAQDVVADPVRPNDLYAFFCLRGVYKSSDYGMTWNKVSTGTNAAHLESGRPWTAAIDPNPARDASTPPTLYTVSGYGDLLGVYKSTDGGVNWTHYAVNNTQGQTSSDVYSLDVDPLDSDHLIAGFHDVGLSESKDGGQTWKTVSVPSSFGISVYAWFVRTGSSSTSSTWLTQAQWGNNTNGMWRTTNSGANWTQVLAKLEHGHGSAQIHQDGHGHIWAAGAGGGLGVIFMSSDYGASWSPVNNANVGQNGVFGTPNYVYATLPAAVQGTQGQHLQRSPASSGTTWSDWSPISPNGMTNGAKRAAVTYDGEHYVIVSGNWLAGLWRYVE